MDQKKRIEELNKEIEGLRLRLSEAKAANTAKEVFLSNMSHDIRTPMNAIVGMTALAKKHIDEKTRVVDALNKIEIASTHLLSLINDVLDMSRINSGRLNISDDVFTLSELIHDTMVIILPQIKKKGHTYELNTENIIEEEFLGDSLRLRQILVNIISNAVKYTPDKGQISLSFSEVAEGDMVRVIFVCRDNGIGMDEEFLKRIYEPFERVNSSTISGVEGTGLGMSIVLKLVEAMKGTIDIKSKPGEGTEVRIEIPLPCVKDKEAPADLKDKHVLILESDERIQEDYRRYLEGETEYKIVSTSEEAFTALADADIRGFEYDAAIIGKSQVNSTSFFDIAAYLKKSYPALKIILASDISWEEIEFRASRSGITGFIPLPFFRGTLLKGINEVLKDDTADTEEGYPDLEGRHILLVEDNLINREIAKEILSVTHAEIDTANDGSEAVDLFTKSPEGYYDIVLMDIQMPVMDGYEATRAIRKLDRMDAGYIPIYAMTANTFAEDIAKAMDSGMDGHIGKPVDINELLRTIGQALK